MLFHTSLSPPFLSQQCVPPAFAVGELLLVVVIELGRDNPLMACLPTFVSAYNF